MRAGEEELNCWKTIPIRCRTPGNIHALGDDPRTLEEDPAGVDRLEQVDAAQQRALAAPAQADHHEHLALVDGRVDAVENEEVAELFVTASSRTIGAPAGAGEVSSTLGCACATASPDPFRIELCV